MQQCGAASMAWPPTTRYSGYRVALHRHFHFETFDVAEDVAATSAPRPSQ